MCEFVNRFPADRRKVEVSLFSVVFEKKSVSGGESSDGGAHELRVSWCPKFNNDSLVVVTKFRSPNRSPNFCVKK